MREFNLEATLVANVRVKANTEPEAKALLEEYLGEATLEFAGRPGVPRIVGRPRLEVEGEVRPA